MRDYGIDGQIGLEQSPELFVAKLVAVFREVRRVLTNDGTLWLNLGDSYAATTKGSGGHNPKQDSNKGSWMNDRSLKIPDGLKPKDLLGIPWRVAFALQADGWYLRSDIIWHKPNPMPESVTDRPTKSHEYVFLMSKSSRYRYDADAIAEPFTDDRRGASGAKNGTPETYAKSAGRGGDSGLSVFSGCDRPGRNARDVWTIPTQGYPEAHFATFPEELARRCILAGCPVGGIVMDPFMGSGTVAEVAAKTGRQWVGCELNPKYAEMVKRRLGLFTVTVA